MIAGQPQAYRSEQQSEDRPLDEGATSALSQLQRGDGHRQPNQDQQAEAAKGNHDPIHPSTLSTSALAGPISTSHPVPPLRISNETVDSKLRVRTSATGPAKQKTVTNRACGPRCRQTIAVHDRFGAANTSDWERHAGD